MLDLITKSVAKIFGTKSDRDIKPLLQYVQKTNAEFAKLTSISDDQLRAKTQDIKDQINAYLKDIDDKIFGLNNRVASEEKMDIHEKESIFGQIDKLELDRNKKLEEVLMQVLPQAFAVVKETARRYKENGKLEVTATDFDRDLAQRRNNVEIVGDKAIWHNKWLAAGTEMTWEMCHYDVQLIGGIVLHQGKIAEMATGEGKTLVATLPAYLNALAGRGVHIVTVNDYLAKRDSEWMGPLFQFHCLKVDCIDAHRPNSNERRQAYLADITYGTNNEFGFDYLRDNMAMSPEELVQRKHHFAMVDEVDSVLIDDARTPLIISGPVPKGDEHEFDILKPIVSRLVEEQRRIITNFFNDAKKHIAAGNEKEGGLPLFRVHRGMPKFKPLIKFLGEPGMKALLQKTENIYLAEHNKLMPEADEPLLFTIDEKHNSIELTDRGIELISKNNDDSNFFVLPDLSLSLDKVEKDTSLNATEKMERKEELIQEYSLKSARIHSVNQLLKAYTLFEKDTEYIVMDNKVLIVDEQTGRVLDGRRYSDGLHQALEAKENVKVEDATQTYATITLQNYFRMYHKICGMTGTAETEASEFWEIYKLDVVVIPTNRNIIRDDKQDVVYKTVREKFNAVIEETEKLVQQGRPVLIGTTSVEISEVLSRMLKMRNVKHQVLNAKQHAKEAEIVAEAGKSGTVTIATNMAGRGTDIKLSPESKAAGGLAIIGTERHESRRVDRQLRGRAGRQGDVGSSQFFVSLEDNLMRLFGSDRIIKIMDRLGHQEGEMIQHSMVTRSIERAQKKVEENNFSIRKRLLEYDNVMNNQREVIYRRRRNALFGERVGLDLMSVVFEQCEEISQGVKQSKDPEDFKLQAYIKFGFNPTISDDDILKVSVPQLTQQLYKQVNEHYAVHAQELASKILPTLQQLASTQSVQDEVVVIPLREGNRQMQLVLSIADMITSQGSALTHQMQKFATLAIIDQLWTSHLRDMDDLKQSVQNASFEQKDPLLVYKFEAFGLFKTLLSEVNSQIVSFIYRSELAVSERDEVQVRKPVTQRAVQRRLSANKDEASSSLQAPKAASAQGIPVPTEEEKPKLAPLQSDKVAGRNDKVSVRYADGSVMRDVKYKNVEQDIRDNKCVLLND